MSNAGDPLNEDETLVMQLLARGKAEKEIALFLGVSPKSMSRRLERVREKLGADTTVHAMAVWQRGRAAFNAMTVATTEDELRSMEDC